MAGLSVSDISDLIIAQQFTVPNAQVKKTVNYITYDAQRSSASGISWGVIPPGKYRLTPSGDLYDCPKGFFCPKDTTQPLYCAARTFCSDASTVKECPAGFFCPMGSTRPYRCNWFASCPVATDTPTRLGIVGIVGAVAIIVAYLFYFKSIRASIRTNKRNLELQKAALLKSENTGKIETRVPSKNTNFDIEFSNLTRKLPNGPYIMKGVSGTLYSGRLCAIMGVSGAGKSTFISLLTNKAPRSEGQVKVGGKKRELTDFAKIIGYVPQEDIMLRELTVSDILTHSALMRLPANTSSSVIQEKVAGIISFLGLSHVSDSIIGTEAERGISGGQRKRVNIGMELVSEPQVLFLDEPTSGLDSSTSLEVCQMLRQITEQRKIVCAAVIHSPSPDTFQQFHDVLLLGKGGQVVYMGPRDHAAQYFEVCGFKCPEGVSESDYFMDVMSGRVKSSFEPNFKPCLLFDYWTSYNAGRPIIALTDKNAVNGEPATKSNSKLDLLKPAATAISMTAAKSRFWICDVASELLSWITSLLTPCRNSIRDTPSSFRVFWLCMKRGFLQVYRSMHSFMMAQLLHLGCGLFISIASQQMEYIVALPKEACQLAPVAINDLCTQPRDQVRFVGLFMSLGVLFAGINVGANTFGDETVVFWRDTSAGMPTIPYFLAKVLVDLPRIIIAALMFSLSMVLLWPYRSEFWTLYLIILILYFCAFAMGYSLSSLVSRERVGLAGTGLALAWSLVFSGMMPSLSDVYSSTGNYQGVSWIWNISAPRYAIESVYIREVQARNLSTSVNSFGYRQEMVDLDLLYMLLIGAGWLVLAFLGLKLTNRDRQK